MNNQERDEAIADLRKRVEEIEARLNEPTNEPPSEPTLESAKEPSPEPAKEG